MTCFVADMAHLNPVDFKKLRAASWNGIKCEAVIHKASQGAHFIDANFLSRRGEALAEGFLVGRYHFNTGELVADQVKNFLTFKPFDREALFLDFEDNKLSQMSLAQAVEFLDRVDQTVGRRCGIYSGNRIKQTVVHATEVQREFLGQRPLWGCQYGPQWKNFDVNGRALPWPAPMLWQFSGDGVGPEPHTLDGLERGADLSIYNCTRAELEKVWAGAPIASAPTVVAQAAPIPPVAKNIAKNIPQNIPPTASRPWWLRLFG